MRVKDKFTKALCLIALAACSACNMSTSSGGANSILPNSRQAFPTAGADYGFSTVQGFARLGSQSQRFELRHGDCGRDEGWETDISATDCERDRQRIERQFGGDDLQLIGNQVWYGWSMFLPSDFADIGPANTTVGQVKLVKWREPLWAIGLRNGQMNVSFANGADCELTRIRPFLGQWADITVFANYSYAPADDSFAVYINGKQHCSSRVPLLTRTMVEQSRPSIYFKWGIYHSYVSRWLNQNKTQTVKAQPFDDLHAKSGHISRSATNAPFAFDWGVELPTQVIFYDEMRVGQNRENVDVGMIEASGSSPLD